MSFLARALGSGANFLAKASRFGSGASRFLGKAMPVIGKSLDSAYSFSQNPLTQQIAGQVLGQSGLNKLNRGINVGANLAGAAPGAYANFQNLAGQARTTGSDALGILQGGQRSLASLYNLSKQ
jgi:hypothetical protein